MIHLLFLFTTTIAISFMHTNSASAFRTSPFYFFIFNKFSYARFFDIFKIFHHAHIIFSTISFIQMFQIIARKFLASKTIFCLACLENYAIFNFAFYTKMLGLYIQHFLFPLFCQTMLKFSSIILPLQRRSYVLHLFV